MTAKQSRGEDLIRVMGALDRYRITSGDSFDLDDHKPDDLPADLSKEGAASLLKHGIKRLSALQELLYANGTWSLLVVLQASDAAGKDSTIKHVMSGVNPQGVSVTSFKQPGPNELAHDFLWRINLALPARGNIGIFNRSHYEDVLVSRVHDTILAASNIPPVLVERDGFWAQRIADIASYEAYLARQGTRVVKFFLNVSFAEQKKRFLKRLDTPEKTWKFHASDLAERAYWGDYRKAYQAAIAGTATPESPWYVIPADRKWFMRIAVAEAIIHALDGLDLAPPHVSSKDQDALKKAHAALDDE